ncbi:hypothetical protein [Paenibacillus tengchongensis]|uniref:hypothetical protein n=1 Tax=Paenibacillus tengchongensis TaxID=2608684 RepID=UPI00124D13D3|nr:hypothetical protein [Paenibacillus tengchongensis]
MTNETTNETTNEISNETATNEPTNGQETANSEKMTEENWNELIRAVHHNGTVALKMKFENVESQILNLAAYGPIFVYHVRNEANELYSCGFFLRELIARFQSGNDPSLWMASFFYELMKTEGGKPLPDLPANEEGAKKIVDTVLVPQLLEAIREEFAPLELHAGLALNEEHGPVFEAGFREITDGPNVCAVPLHMLLTHLQLNRDPSELIIQGLYNIRKQHGLE